MKLSELRPIVTEAHRYGLKKIPKEGMWLTTYMFYEVTAVFYISNLELIYSNVPLAEMLNMKYTEFWKKYQEKFGVREWTTKTLTMTLKKQSENTNGKRLDLNFDTTGGL